MRSIQISGKLTTYPSPKLTLTLTSRLGQNDCLGEGQVGSFPESKIDPIYFCLPSIISNFTNNKSVVFRWLRNERIGKRFSHTRLGVWVQVSMGSSGHMAFQRCLPPLTVAWLAWHGSQLCVKNQFMRQRAYVEILSMREVWRARKRSKSCNNKTHLFSLLSVNKFKCFFLNLRYKTHG